MNCALSHIALAVPDLERALAVYRDRLGARVSETSVQPAHGVRVAFVELGGARIELIAPFGADSPIARFLERHPDGGLHHLCFETPDLARARAEFEAQGGRALGEPKEGAHGRPVLFLHPKDAAGALIELEQA